MNDNWKNILVPQTMLIQDVLKTINSEPLQLALVVDELNRLIGTITDGDIRRALINGTPLTHTISDIMTTAPSVCEYGASREQVLELMRDKMLYSIPILKDGIVVGLETINDVTKKAKYDNPVFLMAGGFGARLKPLTNDCPKPLLKLGGKPILEIQILNLIKAGFHDFYISTHYLPEMIRNYFGSGEKWGVSINYVHEELPLGTGGALGLLPKDLPDLPVIILNGDLLTKIDFQALVFFHNKNSAQGTMCVREYEYQVPFGVVGSDGHNITSMIEKPIHRFHVNAGIYVVGRNIINSVGLNEVIDMPNLLERFLRGGILMFPFHEYWLDIGRMEDFKKAQSDIFSLGLL